jgi:hypothetical protein
MILDIYQTFHSVYKLVKKEYFSVKDINFQARHIINILRFIGGESGS